MPRPELYRQDSSPLGKMVAITVAACLLAGVVMWWWSDYQLGLQADEKLAIGQDHLKNGRLTKALETAESLLDYREKAEYLELKANVLLNQNKPNELIVVLKRWSQLEPEKPHLLANLGQQFLNIGDYDKAAQAYASAGKLAPQNVDFHLKQGFSLYSAGKNEAALNVYAKAVEQWPDYFDAWDQYALALDNLGKTNEALALREKAVKAFPKESLHQLRLAQAYDGREQVDKAVQHYRLSLELKPQPNTIAAKRILELTGQKVAAALERRRENQIPLHLINNQIHIEAVVNGVEGRFLLDTGASMSAIFSNHAPQYGFRRSNAIATASLNTAGGLTQVPIYKGTVFIGDIRPVNVLMAVIPEGSGSIQQLHGIIGLDVLNQFNYSLDKSARLLTLSN